MKKKFTIKKLAIILGEKIGQDVYPRQIKVSGNWLFYKPDQHPQFGYTKDAYPIECYWAKNCHKHGMVSSEPWNHIKKEESPFTYHNQDKVFEVTQVLDKEYLAYINEVNRKSSNDYWQGHR